MYGAPTGLQGTMIAYSKDAPAVTYTQNRASALLVRFKGENGVSLDQARNQLQALLPPDRVLVGTSAAGTGRTADLYHSDLLAAKVGSLTTGGSPGEFVVVYQTNAVGEIESALLAVGGVPKSP